MHPRLSNKILRPDFQGEFTASILAAAASPELISFAGGLPNPVSFPVEEMDKAAHKVLEHNGVMALQYSGTQGYQPLREWVAKRYETMGVSGVQADDIIITNGSQQVLTMMGACMLDPGDKVIVEGIQRVRPGALVQIAPAAGAAAPAAAKAAASAGK